MPKTLRSFKPVVDHRSRILILGTMPGPTALKKQEYYGFSGNQFWKIIAALLKAPQPLAYAKKIRLLKKKGIALWDVFQSCERQGALDSAIQCTELNDIPELLKKYPNIKAIFLNSRTADSTFRKYFASSINRPFYYLPSTSPAHASLSLESKIEQWSCILKFLK
jgi:hypoxanthine-DNA glycosylase